MAKKQPTGKGRSLAKAANKFKSPPSPATILGAGASMVGLGGTVKGRKGIRGMATQARVPGQSRPRARR
jgi:hypothetical protein